MTGSIQNISNTHLHVLISNADKNKVYHTIQLNPGDKSYHELEDPTMHVIINNEGRIWKGILPSDLELTYDGNLKHQNENIPSENIHNTSSFNMKNIALIIIIGLIILYGVYNYKNI